MPLLQYHALGLLYHIRKSDRLAVTKLVQKFARHSLKSPYAYCLLVSDGPVKCGHAFLLPRSSLHKCSDETNFTLSHAQIYSAI